MPQSEVSRETIRDVVRDRILSQDLAGEDPDSLTDDSPLITGGVLDSIGIVRLVTDFEQHFGITFDARDVTVERLDTISRMVDCLEEKIRQTSGSANDA